MSAELLTLARVTLLTGLDKHVWMLLGINSHHPPTYVTLVMESRPSAGLGGPAGPEGGKREGEISFARHFFIGNFMMKHYPMLIHWHLEH